MLKDRHIAFFIDVDNVGITSDTYANVLDQLNAMGTILSGKIYGAGERKHKEIYAEAELKGYKLERSMRVKRRGRKEFDARIFVDVVDAVISTPAIDAVCIIAEPTDLVYLYSYLRAHGVKIIALDNADDASCQFIDEVIDLGIVLELKLPKTKSVAKPIVVAEKQPVAQQSTTQQAETGEEQPAVAEKQLEDTTTDGLDRTNELLEEIKRLRSLVEEYDEQPAPAPEMTEQSATNVAEETAEDTTPVTAPRAPANDAELVRRIEEARRGNQDEDDDLIEQISKLLKDFE